jgi:hypothetical protein
MDFHEAILAHTRWKMHLLQFIQGSGDPLVAADVARDDLCALGKWLHGEGTEYASYVTYDEASTAHAAFHLRAAEVVRSVEGGDREGAERMLHSGAPYAEASDAVVLALTKLRVDVRRHQ